MQPLEGLKVLDLTRVMAGPYCTMVLGDLGAEVIKIEKIQSGDDTRSTPPFIHGESANFMQINRNKKSVTLNVKSARGKEIFFQLAAESDVIVENFKPGVMSKLGLDYEAVCRINPGIIYCSISGYGQTGPYRDKRGFDIVAQGMTGLMSMTGEPGGRPVKLGIAINDLTGGVTALYSILAAYVHKLKTGEGQYIDVSIMESGLAWTFWEAAAFFADGTVPKPNGSRHRVMAPYQAFRAKDGYVLVGGANQSTWERFCTDVIDKPEWIEDERFARPKDRIHNVDILERCIEDIFVCETKDYWVSKLEQAGVPGGPINTFDQAMNDPHVLEREMVLEAEHPVAGKTRMLGIPAKMSRTPGKIRSAAPLLGEHTEEVLGSYLGMSKEEIEMLRRQDVI
ncbi:MULTISPECIES: CaiB/BaiF CoA transferase family protein [Paenibacillus]|uniref:CoA transferase n=2 Tax=Paenibacillus TaxID=44249 RepID=A0A6M1PUJ1_9BACL|nr:MULTISPECIES: CoA transferase [Paenibacillus]NGM83921.1 CoA transferase [Paenibacillus apii]NJJ40561.1 CoA transferase [Paenibacillus apii]RQW10569.1 CoA transferase [Paenibacillus rhizophilus]